MNCVPVRASRLGASLLSSLFVIRPSPSRMTVHSLLSSSTCSALNARPMKYVRSGKCYSFQTSCSRDVCEIIVPLREDLRIVLVRPRHAEETECLRPVHHERHPDHSVEHRHSVTTPFSEKFGEQNEIALPLRCEDVEFDPIFIDGLQQPRLRLRPRRGFQLQLRVGRDPEHLRDGRLVRCRLQPTLQTQMLPAGFGDALARVPRL